MRVGGVIESAEMPTFWRTWWLGDATGALVFLPMLLAWAPDDPFFTRRGFLGAGDFLKQYQRLSAVLFHMPLATGDEPANVLWLNAIARHRLPNDLRNALQRLGRNE